MSGVSIRCTKCNKLRSIENCSIGICLWCIDEEEKNKEFTIDYDGSKRKPEFRE